MQSPNHPKYWFPAKRYGWGWGLPTTWQGWCVLAVYLALIIVGIPALQAPKGNLIYIAYVLGATAVFVVICRLKGEPPRWRWGDRDN
jgi:hypothetical protein